MLINAGRRTISRDEEERRQTAFLAQHEEQRLALRVGSTLTAEEKVFMRALRSGPSRGKVFGAARHEAVKLEPVFTGDLEADLVAEQGQPVNFDRVGG
jgi:hypothetical protein